MAFFVRIIPLVLACLVATSVRAGDFRTIVLVDVSDSMAYAADDDTTARIEVAQQALTGLLVGLVDAGASGEIAVHLWNRRVLPGQSLVTTGLNGRTLRSVKKQVRSMLQIQPTGQTYPGAALAAVLSELESSHMCVPTSVVIITDDPPNRIGQPQFVRQARRAIRMNVTLGYLVVAHPQVYRADEYYAAKGQTADELRQIIYASSIPNLTRYAARLHDVVEDELVCLFG